MQEIFRNERGVVFEWTPKCHPMPNSLIRYKSPQIAAVKNTWFFTLCPNGNSENYRDWIGVDFCRLDPLEGEVWFKIGIKLAGATEREIVSHKMHPESHPRFRITKLLHRSRLLKKESELNLTGQLTITCKLWTDEQPTLEDGEFFTLESTTDNLPVKSAKEEERSHLSPAGSTPSQLDWKLIRKEFVSREAQTEEQSGATAGEENGANLGTKVYSTFQKHLKDLLVTGDDHDVAIKVGNQKFKAHKCMLRSRSPVFAAMFKHKMKESEDGSITIDDCEPDAFGEFLNYVYTGKVEDLSPRKATGLYYAGDKYDFSELKEVCVHFLEASLSTTSICDVINLATRHGEKGLLESAIKFFSENTKEILITEEWQQFATNNFVELLMNFSSERSLLKKSE